ncbi:hypothetical protein KC336_g75 [Hortaea werneckii]|nr:hypothetical protein KC336_g75 [Hortaea werneckii]
MAMSRSLTAFGAMMRISRLRRNNAMEEAQRQTRDAYVVVTREALTASPHCRVFLTPALGAQRNSVFSRASRYHHPIFSPYRRYGLVHAPAHQSPVCSAEGSDGDIGEAVEVGSG